MRTNSMKILLKTLVAICVMSMASGVSASVITIDFDDVLFSTPFQLVSEDAYQDQGVVFENSLLIENFVVAEPGFVSTALSNNATSPNYLPLATTDASGNTIVGLGLSLSGFFVVAGTNQQAVTDSISFDAYDTEIGSILGTLTAFDIDGNEIVSTTLTTPASKHSLLSVSAPGIASFVLSTDPDGAGFDNLTFTTPVSAPEPTTTALLALGLFGVGAVARRRLN